MYTPTTLSFRNKCRCNEPFKNGIKEMVTIEFRMMVIMSQGRQADVRRAFLLHLSSQVHGWCFGWWICGSLLEY